MYESSEDVNAIFNEQERVYNLQVQTILNALSDRITEESRRNLRCGRVLDIDLDELCDQLADELNMTGDRDIFSTELTGEEIWNLQDNELKRLQIFQIMCDLTHRELTFTEFMSSYSAFKEDIFGYMDC